MEKFSFPISNKATSRNPTQSAITINVWINHGPAPLIQDVPKGTGSFQSLIIKKLDNLRKFFLYH